MAMTLSEKILARASGKESSSAGEIVQAEIDWIMTNDATTHVSIDIFEQRLHKQEIRHPERVIWVVDHNIPAESVETANVHRKQRLFAEKHGFNTHIGEGVCHQLLVERYVMPGQVVIGADSHTCSHGALGAFATGVGSTDLVGAIREGSLWFMVPATLRFELTGALHGGVTTKDLILTIIGDISGNGANYRTMEFAGSGLDTLSLESRIALANLAVEAGAKNAIMEADGKVLDYLAANRPPSAVKMVEKSDPAASFEKVCRYDLSKIEPVVACPHTVDNVSPIGEVEGLPLDQVFVGSCSNGRIEDLRLLAGILKGKRVHDRVRLAVSPASQRVYLQAVQEGLIRIFLEAGAMVLNPNCSTCWGGCQAVVGDGERLLSTGTRNFKGRSGSASAEVFLGSVYTAAASALAGEIVSPRKYLRIA
jgi:3-isopropylmalate/(R)-2-methylmalate dehydratase large subunit